MNTIANFDDMLQIIRSCIIDNLSDFEKDRVYLVLMDMEKKSVMNFLNTGWSSGKYDGIPSRDNGTYDMKCIYDLCEKIFRKNKVDCDGIRDYDHMNDGTERYVMLEYYFSDIKKRADIYYFIEGIFGMKVITNLKTINNDRFRTVCTHKCKGAHECKSEDIYNSWSLIKN